MAGDQHAESPDFGPYRILGMLGQGGMGVVYRAYDTVNDRIVALKKLPVSAADPEFRARFQRESRLAAALSHPNIIPVHDFGEIDGQLYLDMMLVDGTDLRRMLGQGSVDQDRAIAVLRQVARALDAAHEGGLVHRDVKPSNILVDGAGKAYLADFGIARETSAEATALTQSGDLIGSWDYMAPERLSRGLVDGRADQYSLACVLFECLTGRLPYPADDMAGKVAAHLLQPPPAPSVFVPTITPALDAVVLRGLAKEPARRFDTATALLSAAEGAAYSGETARSARPTAAGPSKERDQGRLVKAIVRASAARRPATRRLGAPVCPYPGLNGFERADADMFHGRDHVVSDLLVRLAEQLDGGEPVVVVGASGSGKSSVLRAGLLPALAGEASEDEWPQIVLAPGPDPVGGLAAAMAARSTVGALEWARVIRETPTRFGELCARSVGGATTRPVILVDQFEELFTYGATESDRIAYATALTSASPAIVVLAVRADLVDRCIELAPLRPALTAPVLLGPMDATELRQAIVTPARDAGLEIEPGLPERLIADLGVRGEIGYDPGALPRLAHALRETWNHREGNVLTLAAYRRVGGIDGAVSRTADEIHDRLDPLGRQYLRDTMLRMVTVFDDGTAVRRRVDPRELPAPVIVDYLITARLVTVDGTGARLSHEALLTAWPRLRGWIDEDRAGLIQHRRFTDAVRVWAESGQHGDDLYRGVRLASLVSWLEMARDRVRLQPVEQEFLVRSNSAEQAGQVAARKRTRRLRVLVAALSVLLLVASGAVVVATKLQQDAADARDRADASLQLSLSRQLAAEAAQARGVDPRRSALTALGSWLAGDTVESRSAILSGLSDSYRGRMTGHEGVVSSIAMSHDGNIAATGGMDGTLRLWDLPARRQLAVLDEDSGAWYRTLSMSADGKLLAVANPNKHTVTLWDVAERKVVKQVNGVAIDTVLSADGKTMAALTDRGVVVWDTKTWAELGAFVAKPSIFMAMSPDTKLIATTDETQVQVHRVSDGALVATLVGHTGNVSSMAFNPAGTMVATASMDGSVRLWDTAQWTSVRTMTNSEGGFSSVVFSPTGSVVVGSGIGTSVYVWDPTNGANLARLATRSVTTYSVALTGDGHTLVGADSAGEVSVWSLLRVTLGSRTNAMIGTAFQPKSDLVASVDGGGMLELWDTAKGDLVKRVPAHKGIAYDVAFRPDGSELVTVGEDGVVVLWKPDGTELRRFSRPGTVFTAVRFSPDGKTIAVGGRAPVTSNEDRDELLLLDAGNLAETPTRRPTRTEPRNAQGGAESNYPNGIAFSPDGRTLAITLSAGKVGLWNLVDTGGELTILPGHDGIAIDAEFSPDGATLATAGSDRVVRLWRVRDGQQVGVLTGSDSTVRRISFSPDGKMLAGASQDTVLRLWDVPNQRPLARLDRHEDQLNDVAFDSTGTRVASVGAEGVTRIWDLDPAHGVTMICGVLDKDSIGDEWQALGPDRGAVPSCPK